MHVNMGKKKTYHQVTQKHTDTASYRGCFFKTEGKNKQRNVNWEVSERILDDLNTTI